MKIATSGGHSASGAAASKTAVSPARQIPTPSFSQGAFRQGAIADEKRRSQRVLLRVRTSVHVAVKGKDKTLEASTVSVNPQGALMLLKESLPAETKFILEHGGTREKVACRVTRSGKEMPEGFHVPVEFDAPAPGFWKIDFPPIDWRPEDA